MRFQLLSETFTKVRLILLEVFKVLGIEFAPLDIPLERRLQTFAVVITCLDLFVFGYILLYLFISLFFTKYYLLSVIYLLWMIYDNLIIRDVDRIRPNIRGARVYKHFADYFPITLHKTADLDPERNYVIGYHPHGIYCMGAVGNFAFDVTGFDQLFPGIKRRVLTLSLNFWLPLQREVLGWFGIHSVSRETIQWMLSKQGKGNAAVIVVGGAQESLDAVPNTMELVLKTRKGFVREALIYGASLVPCISFGENEIFVQYGQPESSWLKKLRRKWTRIFKLAPVFFHGRGIFQYNFGMFPFRHPIHTIVGKPIHTVATPNPSLESIDKLHQRYIQELVELFEQNKHKYADNPNMEIVIK